MKALIVAPYYYPKIGGLENYAHQLNKALQHKQWEIVVITSNHAQHTTIKETIDGIVVYRLKPWFKLFNTPVNLLWLFSIKRIINAEKPDLILAHTPVPSLADATALVAGKVPFVLIYHAATLFKEGSWVFSVIAHLYKLYEQITLAKARRIVAVSQYVKDQFSERLQKKLTVIPNAVNAADIVERAQPTNPDFLFVGSLDRTHAWKGLDHILAAIADTPGYELSIMGDGNDRPRYEALVRELQLQRRVTFLGNLTGQEKDAAFRKAFALIMYPKSANDALPTVMLEAWARQVPVIAAAIGPIPSLITDGIDGYLVAPNNSKALTACLTAVAESTSEDRSLIAQAASEQVKQHFTWDRQAESIAALAKEIV